MAIMFLEMQMTDSARELSMQLHAHTQDAVALLVNHLTDIADTIKHLNTALATCTLPNSPAAERATAYELMRLYNAVEEADNLELGSLGIIAPAGVPHAQAGLTSKLSWQVARGYGCPANIYAALGASSYPTLTGHCIPTGDSAANLTYYLDVVAPSYVGEDWGLLPAEEALLVPRTTHNYTVLAAKPVLGVMTLTYYQNVWCNGAPVALTFAEQSLAQLDATLKTLHTDELESGGTTDVVIVERATGLIVASSYALDLEARVYLGNTTHAGLRALRAVVMPKGQFVTFPETAKPYGEHPQRAWVVSQSVVLAGSLEWVVITSVRPAGFYAYLDSMVAGLIISVLTITVTMALIFALAIRFTISASLLRLSERFQRVGADDGGGEMAAFDIEADDGVDSIITEVQLLSSAMQRRQ